VGKREKWPYGRPARSERALFDPAFRKHRILLLKNVELSRGTHQESHHKDRGGKPPLYSLSSKKISCKYWAGSGIVCIRMTERWGCGGLPQNRSSSSKSVIIFTLCEVMISHHSRQSNSDHFALTILFDSRDMLSGWGGGRNVCQRCNFA